MAKLVHVIVGETGDYDDHHTWLVCARLSEDSAKRIVAELNAWCGAQGVGWSESDSGPPYERIYESMRRLEDGKIHPELDPNFRCESTGTLYDYESIELEE